MKSKNHRTPKGKTNAMRNNARPGAIPPAKEDMGDSHKSFKVMRYAFKQFGIRFWGEKIKVRPNFNDFFLKLKAKFPTYKSHEAKEIYYDIIEFSD